LRRRLSGVRPCGACKDCSLAGAGRGRSICWDEFRSSGARSPARAVGLGLTYDVIDTTGATLRRRAGASAAPGRAPRRSHGAGDGRGARVGGAAELRRRCPAGPLTLRFEDDQLEGDRWIFGAAALSDRGGGRTRGFDFLPPKDRPGSEGPGVGAMAHWMRPSRVIAWGGLSARGLVRGAASSRVGGHWQPVMAQPDDLDVRRAAWPPGPGRSSVRLGLASLDAGENWIGSRFRFLVGRQDEWFDVALCRGKPYYVLESRHVVDRLGSLGQLSFSVSGIP